MRAPHWDPKLPVTLRKTMERRSARVRVAPRIELTEQQKAELRCVARALP